MIAAVALVGRPSVSSGTSVPAAEALFAASGPATPSIAPCPNSSGCLASAFSVEYDRKVPISAPPAGIAPIGKPMSVPRSQGFHDRDQSSRVIHTEPLTASTFSSPCTGDAATFSASPIAKSATASVVTSMPSSRSGTPKASRACPVCRSMPTSPSVSPRKSAVMPRSAESPKAAETVMKASTISAK